MSYTYTYDDSPLKQKRHHLWWQTSVTQAGLLVNSISTAMGNRFNERDKNLLGNKFAQFAKLTSEIRYNYDLGNRHHLVGRLMGGIAYSYGNSVTTPYSEQFYIGGANSLRAFTIRSIGPGSFRPSDSQYGYLDQTGDIKFEANLEYRFPILGDLHGATFLDAGNVWLLRYDENRPGGQLKWGRFLKDLAFGNGHRVALRPYVPCHPCRLGHRAACALRHRQTRAITTSRTSKTAWACIWPSGIRFDNACILIPALP